MKKILYAENGVPLLVYENPAMRGFCLGVYVKAGSIYESRSENGCAHLFEHMLFRNLSAKFGENIDVLLQNHSLAAAAFTYKYMVHVQLSGAESGLPFACEILSALFSDFDMAKDDFEGEKAVIKAEIRESDERRSPAYLMERRVWAGTNAAQTILGYCRNIDRITQARLNDYKRAVLSGNNVFLCLTGNGGPDAAAQILAAAARFPLQRGAQEKQNATPRPARFGRRDADILLTEWKYPGLRFAFDVDYEKVTHETADAVYRVLLDGAASLLNLSLREREHLIYSYDSTQDEYANLSSLRFDFELPPKDFERAVSCTVETLNRLKRGDFDFETFLQRELTVWDLMRDSKYELNATMAEETFILPMYPAIDYDAPLWNRYRHVTKAGMCAAAAEIFRTDNLILQLKGGKRDLARYQPRIREALQTLNEPAASV